MYLINIFNILTIYIYICSERKIYILDIKIFQNVNNIKLLRCKVYLSVHLSTLLVENIHFLFTMQLKVLYVH